jgi:hypothetical protein
MKPPEKKWPHVNVAGRQPERPSAHARTFKPAVAQLKSAAPARPHPVTPPVYRPQSKPPVAQRKTAHRLQTSKQPVAPPAYRPPPAPKVLQTKVTTRRHDSVQAKPKRPAAPPVYSSQSVPKVLQRKTGNPSGVAGPRAGAPPTARNRVVPVAPRPRVTGGAIQRAVDDDWEASAGKFLMQMDEEIEAIRKSKAVAPAAPKPDEKKAPVIAPPHDPATGEDIVRLAKAGLLTVGPPKDMNTLSFDPDEPRDPTTGQFNSYDQNYSYPLSYGGRVIAYLHAHYNTKDRTKVSTVKARFNVKDPAAESTKARGGYILDYAPKSLEDAAKALQH